MKEITREELKTVAAGEVYHLPEFKVTSSFDIVHCESYTGEHRRIARVFDRLPPAFPADCFDTSVRADGKIVVETWQRNDDAKDRYEASALKLSAAE